ncbi:MAG TPA: hypothetical protein VJ768_09970 [Anaerolineales bacterium]|nr:hypothetical protein [Anaerolineales bacterium]
MAQIRSVAYDSIILEALGQTWYFTPDVVSELANDSADPKETLRTLVLSHGSLRGYEDGVYHVDDFGILLRLTVRESSIIVDDPYS